MNLEEKNLEIALCAKIEFEHRNRNGSSLVQGCKSVIF